MACMVLVGCLIATGFAQVGGRNGPAQPHAGDRIAVIDINYIFKNHVRLNHMVEDWKKDVKALDDSMRNEKRSMEGKIRKLQEYKIGSLEYKRLEEEIAKQQSELQVRATLAKKDFQLRETKMYLDVYREVQGQVDYFARRHGITMVLRYNRSKINEDDPRQRMQLVMRPVVFQNNIDITIDILQRLNPPEGARISDERSGPGSTIPQGRQN